MKTSLLKLRYFSKIVEFFSTAFNSVLALMARSAQKQQKHMINLSLYSTYLGYITLGEVRE